MDKPVGQTELRILLLEDMPTDAELVEEALREAGLSFTAKRVDTREAFIRALEEFKPDIVLADYNLPAFDGGSALKIVQQQYPAMPVVMVTGAVGDEKAVELLELGARDYVLKDRLARLGFAVRRALSEERGIHTRKAIEKELRASEQKFMRFFMLIPIPLAVVNTDGIMIHVNARFTEALGYTRDDVPTLQEWWQLAYPDEPYRRWVQDTWNAAVAKAAKEGVDIEPIEYRVACKSGAERIMLIGGAYLDGTLLATLIDITERKQVESRLTEQLDELRRWHEATLGREMRTLELKHEVNELLAQAGQPPRYPSAEQSNAEG
ncbi:MAG: response regulator [Gallionella sp.]|nr:response regulator [Gallionella sp.]